jgi:hypothetical protein
VFTLEEFVQRSAAEIEAFAAAIRASQAEGVEGFVGKRFELRSEADWWREVAAYYEYIEFQDSIAKDRRSDLIERRRRVR